MKVPLFLINIVLPSLSFLLFYTSLLCLRLWLRQKSYKDIATRAENHCTNWKKSKAALHWGWTSDQMRFRFVGGQKVQWKVGARKCIANLTKTKLNQIKNRNKMICSQQIGMRFIAEFQNQKRRKKQSWQTIQALLRTDKITIILGLMIGFLEKGSNRI